MSLKIYNDMLCHEPYTQLEKCHITKREGWSYSVAEQQTFDFQQDLLLIQERRDTSIITGVTDKESNSVSSYNFLK